MKSCLKCNQKIPATIKIENRIRNLCNRKFCLSCSPFGSKNRRNLTIDPIQYKDPNFKFLCRHCNKKKKITEFYKRSESDSRNRRINIRSRCISCDINKAGLYVSEARRTLKKLSVQYKGGKCIKCGYDRCVDALEFHHRSREEKVSELGKYKTIRLTEAIKKELDKCDLVCANCHREIEYEIRRIKDN